jgi:HSP20 family protein
MPIALWSVRRAIKMEWRTDVKFEEDKKNKVVRWERNSIAQRIRDTVEGVMPAADILETESTFMIQISMPGASPASIDVSLQSDLLMIRGAREGNVPEYSRVIRKEISSAQAYYREFRLGEGIDREHIDAQYEDGVLEICLSKKESTKVQIIQVR